MKKIAYLFFLLLIISCADNKEMSFCEGTDMNGNGVKCGKKFHTGDLTAVVKSDSPMSGENLNIEVKKITEEDSIKVDSFKVKINSGDTQKSFNLPMYNEGTFQVNAMSNGKKISSGTVTLVE